MVVLTRLYTGIWVCLCIFGKTENKIIYDDFACELASHPYNSLQNFCFSDSLLQENRFDDTLVLGNVFVSLVNTKKTMFMLFVCWLVSHL